MQVHPADQTLVVDLRQRPRGAVPLREEGEPGAERWSALEAQYVDAIGATIGGRYAAGIAVEGLTVWRRPLSGGGYGVDVGPDDEIGLLDQLD